MASRPSRRAVSRAVAALGGLHSSAGAGALPFNNRALWVGAAVGCDRSTTPTTTRATMLKAPTNGGGALRPRTALAGVTSLFIGFHQRQQTRWVARETATAPDGVPAADGAVVYMDDFDSHLPSPSTSSESPPAPRSDQSYLDGMNDEQRAAILAPVAPMKVLAGPGSGKTRVLVGRVTHLINELGVPPSHILCITFTNKAAREMRERLEASIGPDNAAAITAGTFHSVASRMLRKHIHLLEDYGRGNDFTIYDETDTKSLLRDILVEHFNEDKKNVDTGLAKGRISAAKNAVQHCVGLRGNRMMQALLESRPVLKHDPAVMKGFPRLYDEYEAGLRAANAMDFDDLLSATVVGFYFSSSPVNFFEASSSHQTTPFDRVVHTTHRILCEVDVMTWWAEPSSLPVLRIESGTAALGSRLTSFFYRTVGP